MADMRRTSDRRHKETTRDTGIGRISPTGIAARTLCAYGAVSLLATLVRTVRNRANQTDQTDQAQGSTQQTSDRTHDDGGHGPTDAGRSQAPPQAPDYLKGGLTPRPGRDDEARPETEEDSRGRDAEAPSEIPARGWKDILVRVKTNVVQDDVPLAAAGTAFYGFLALIPALAAAIAVYGLVATPRDAARRVEELFTALPSEASELVQDQVRTIAGSSASGLSVTAVVGLASALWAASSGVSHLMQAVNQAYGEKHTRAFPRQRGLAVVLTAGAILIGGAAVSGIAVVPALVQDAPGVIKVAAQLAVWLGVALLFLLGLAVLYRYGPERDEPRWRWVSTGAVIGLVLWLAVTLGLRFYAASFGSYNETYGTLAGVVLLLLWMFASAFAVLVAAQINAEMEHQTAEDTTEGPEKPMGRRDARMADTLGRAT